MERKKIIYSVSVALDATWKNNIYTYHSQETLNVGDVVSVPFGKLSRLGYIESVSVHTSHKTKPIERYLGFSLPKETRELVSWLNSTYPNVPGLHLQHLLPSFVGKIKSFVSDSSNIPLKPKLANITKVQLTAYEKLESSARPAVLHGFTGSGKTRVYCELASKAISEGKNVLILYPEISLTSQLQETLIEAFGSDKVSVFHSKKTLKQMQKTWLSALNSTGGHITIGPRSALFLPHSNLGLIIVDEAHDGSYKQDNGSRYNGLNVAAALSNIHKAKLVLGSATPPIQETYQITAKGGDLVCMHSLALEHTHLEKTFRVVDMTKKENRLSSIFMLSKALSDDISNNIKNNFQTLLFLNRRGTAHMLLCENCGWHAECPRCDMPLTYHHDKHRLQCHFCGLSKPSYNSCPECGSDLTQKSPGTKAIESDIKKLFPGATVARFDSDNKKSDSFAEQYQTIKNGNVDIIIGTQLITKGLDLPKLQTVGILQADSQLFLPDYSSEERAFQQLSQVSGRVGRGHTRGSVILQTYQPASSLFALVESQDWHEFYEKQLSKRRKNVYPPFSFAMKISISKSNSKSAENSIKKLVSNLNVEGSYKVLGPAPSFYSKSGDKFFWQVVVLSKSRKILVDIAKNLPKEFIYDLDPSSLL